MAVVRNAEISNPQSRQWMSLANYHSTLVHRRSRMVRVLWYVTSICLFESACCPLYGVKRWLLRCFGATIGAGVVIKPRVRIKFPWNLQIGDHTWIGEDVWIDNLAAVQIGSNACVSQGVYLCTGSHDSRQVTFDLIVEPIVIEDEAWVAARSMLLPGVNITNGVLVAAGSVVTKSTAIPPGMIVAGVPARIIGPRGAEK